MPPLILPSRPETPFDASGPRQDFLLLTESLGGTLLYPKRRDADSLLARLEQRTATDIRQAFAALKRRRSVSVYVSLSEKVGVPLALLLPKGRANRPAHVLVGHRLTSPNKRTLHARTGYLHRFDRVVVLATTQSFYLTQEADYPEHRVALLLDAVDARFWSASEIGRPPAPNSRGAGVLARVSKDVPTRDAPTGEAGSLASTPAPLELGAGGAPHPYILAVGRERRDYTAFVDALRQMPDTQAVVVASSPWSRSAGLFGSREMPTNIQLRQDLPYATLRQLYAGASLVVVPLLPGTDYAAGVNACLEAMAMGVPVLATATPGLEDYRRDEADAELIAVVPEGGPTEQLRTAIRSLLADPARCKRLAIVGRKFIEQRANLDVYVANVARLVQESLRER